MQRSVQWWMSIVHKANTIFLIFSKVPIYTLVAAFVNMQKLHKHNGPYAVLVIETLSMSLRKIKYFTHMKYIFKN